MKLGIIGLSGSGKTTVFEALTGQMPDSEHKGDDRIGSIRVPDHRVDVLSDMYHPQKTTHAKVEYLLEGSMRLVKDAVREQAFGTKTRDCSLSAKAKSRNRVRFANSGYSSKSDSQQ